MQLRKIMSMIIFYICYFSNFLISYVIHSVTFVYGLTFLNPTCLSVDDLLVLCVHIEVKRVIELLQI